MEYFFLFSWSSRPHPIVHLSVFSFIFFFHVSFIFSKKHFFVVVKNKMCGRMITCCFSYRYFSVCKIEFVCRVAFRYEWIFEDPHIHYDAEIRVLHTAQIIINFMNWKVNELARSIIVDQKKKKKKTMRKSDRRCKNEAKKEEARKKWSKQRTQRITSFSFKILFFEHKFYLNYRIPLLGNAFVVQVLYLECFRKYFA